MLDVSCVGLYFVCALASRASQLGLFALEAAGIIAVCGMLLEWIEFHPLNLSHIHSAPVAMATGKAAIAEV